MDPHFKSGGKVLIALFVSFVSARHFYDFEMWLLAYGRREHPVGKKRRRASSSQHEGTKESFNRPVHSSPGLRVMGFSIAAPSTQSICLYSSSPRSIRALDFLSHGFQTTVLRKRMRRVQQQSYIFIASEIYVRENKMKFTWSLPTSGSPSLCMMNVRFLSWSKIAISDELRYTRSTWERYEDPGRSTIDQFI